MTSDERTWLERHAAAWEARAADLADGDAGARVRAECLRLIVAGLRARLAAAPAAAELAPAVVGEAVTWRSAVFWPGGRFDPFAGTKAMRMLASAAVCRAFGDGGAARVFEARAVEIGNDHAGDVATPPRWGMHADFSLPVPEPAPFRAGPQMDMFG